MPLDAHATEEEDKLILLSSLSRLGGCTEEQLLRFLVESALMNPFQFYLALGGLTQGVTPLEMAGAYGALCAKGTHHEPHFVARIETADGETLYESSPKTQFFVSEQSAYTLSEMLRYTVQTGTAAALQTAGVPLAAKTGTVDYEGLGNRDIWAAAYNDRYCAVVWMGMDETNAESYLPASATGGRNSTEALCRIFRAL